jgi:LysR family hydrogen peroxide-inducible transcriptional activator
MEMHQIRYFLALSEELNFTRAARRCGVTQPSLTNAMRALERELGAPLFHRRPRIELTALGGAIRPYLQEIARHAHDARETARAFVPEVTVSGGPESFHAMNGGMPQAVYTGRT